jgi:hypothetical protein
MISVEGMGTMEEDEEIEGGSLVHAIEKETWLRFCLH